MKEEVTKPYGDIYFEKNLPKNCGGCPFQYDGISCEALEYDYCPEELGRCLDSKYGTAAYDDAIFDRRYSKCPLQTTQFLKQQVREEVVEEIKEKFNTEVRNHFCPNPSSVDFITLCISEVEEFLDQVKGENNVKD